MSGGSEAWNSGTLSMPRPFFASLMDDEITEALSRLLLVSGGPERGTSAPDL